MSRRQDAKVQAALTALQNGDRKGVDAALSRLNPAALGQFARTIADPKWDDAVTLTSDGYRSKP